MAIKYPWILAILAALTIYLGYLFYKSPSVLGFIFMFLPLIAYLLILKLYDEVEPNLAKILDDAARSDWGRGTQIPMWDEVMVHPGLPPKVNAEFMKGESLKGEKELFACYMLRRGNTPFGKWSEGIVAHSKYKPLMDGGQPMYGYLSPTMEPRSEGEIRKWFRIVVTGQSANQGILNSLVSRLFKKKGSSQTDAALKLLSQQGEL